MGRMLQVHTLTELENVEIQNSRSLLAMILVLLCAVIWKSIAGVGYKSTFDAIGVTARQDHGYHCHYEMKYSS